MNQIVAIFLLTLLLSPGVLHAEKSKKASEKIKTKKTAVTTQKAKNSSTAAAPKKIVAAKATPTPTPQKNESSSVDVPLNQNFSDAPTEITSQTLTLLTEERRFIYERDVVVKQEDMTLTAATLEGFYDENNKIQKIYAKKSVTITKGPDLKAFGDRADYDAVAKTIVLTESPRVEQSGSILTADLIRIFLEDNRSVAEGSVKVTVVQKKKEGAQQDAPAPAPQSP